jgi:hypothetical protein
MTSARQLLFTAVAALALALCTTGATAAPGFKRGATLVEFFNFPKIVGTGADKTYANPPYPQAQAALAQINFADLRRIGFDHMRVPINVGPLMAGDEKLRADIIAQLVAVVTELQRHELGVLVTLYPPSLQKELPETYLDGLDGPKFRLYFAMVDRIARALVELRNGLVALEPMNEPQDKCRATTGLDWTLYQEFMVARIRSYAPELNLFLTGGCWSNIEGIVLLDTDLLRDRRNFVSVHFYYPFLFTHQTATWTMPYLAGTIGVPYPAATGSEHATVAMTRHRFKSVTLRSMVDQITAPLKAEREIHKYFLEKQGPAQIGGWMKQVADWQEKQRIDAGRIVFTEFGAMKQLINGVEFDKPSRVRWLRDASSAIERQGWGWTVYVLKDDPFGLYERRDDRYPDPELLRALRLDVPKDDRAAR